MTRLKAGWPRSCGSNPGKRKRFLASLKVPRRRAIPLCSNLLHSGTGHLVVILKACKIY